MKPWSARRTPYQWALNLLTVWMCVTVHKTPWILITRRLSIQQFTHAVIPMSFSLWALYVSASVSASSTYLAPPEEWGTASRDSSDTPFSLTFKGKLSNMTCMNYVSRFSLNKTYNKQLKTLISTNGSTATDFHCVVMGYMRLIFITDLNVDNYWCNISLQGQLQHSLLLLIHKYNYVLFG